MKNKTVKKMIAALAAAAMITTSTVPTLAAENTNLVTATNHFGETYKIDYAQGAAEIGGRRIYFGYSLESPRVKACGWRTAVGLKAAELADMMSYDPDWWEWFSGQYPTTEQYYSWKAQK